MQIRLCHWKILLSPGCPGKTRDKLAGSKFRSLEVGEGEDYLLRTRKQRIKFAKFRAVESQRMERNSGGLTLILKQRVRDVGC